MRDRVPAAETAVGIAILLLLGGIVGAFFGTVRPSDDKLFELDPKYVEAAGPPREDRVAAEMMPTLPPSWRTVGRAEAVGPGAISAWVGDAAPALVDGGLAAAYRGRFEATDGSGASLDVMIFDMGSPEKAAQAAEARAPSGAARAPLGLGGWVLGRRAGFWSGRYYTEVESGGPEAERQVRDAAQLVAASQLAYGPARAEAGATEVRRPSVASRATGSARFPEVAGFEPPAAIRRFDKDTLYEKIDGKAGMFLGYLFVELEFGTYQKLQGDRQFDVYVYDMGEPANAFGIYRTERGPDVVTRPLGREGYTSGASVFFWKGKYYVNVLGPPDEPGAAADAEKIALAVAAAIADEGGPFWAEAILPQAGLKKGSLTYKATDALGYGFLRGVFIAQYSAGGKDFQLFIHRAASPEQARSLFEQYARLNKPLTRRPCKGGELLVADSLGVFEAVFYNAHLFGGVTECEDAELAARQAEAFCTSLDPAGIAPRSATAAGAPGPKAGDTKPAEASSEESGGYGEY